MRSIPISQSKETTRGDRSQLWFFGPSGEIRCRCAFGHIVRCCRHRAGGKQQSTGLLHLDGSNLLFQSNEKERDGKSHPFLFGPSGEIRTPGILIPKAQDFIFLNFYTTFCRIYSGNSSFPEPSAPGISGLFGSTAPSPKSLLTDIPCSGQLRLGQIGNCSSFPGWRIRLSAMVNTVVVPR